jgi:hypothetical protein
MADVSANQQSGEYHLFTDANGYQDFDIVGHPVAKRAAVSDNINRGDIFNVYCHDGRKVGVTWRGSLEASISASKHLAVAEMRTAEEVRIAEAEAEFRSAIGPTSSRFVDRHGRPIDAGDRITVQFTSGRYGQVSSATGVVHEITDFGVDLCLEHSLRRVERDGAVRYLMPGERAHIALHFRALPNGVRMADHRHEDVEHGHQTWIELLSDSVPAPTRPGPRMA